MMSRYLSNSYLYLSTWALSCSIASRSFSMSASFAWYSSRMTFYFCSRASMNCGCSSMCYPPMSIELVNYLIFSSSHFRPSFSLIKSIDLASRAVMAACLSASARLFSSSSYTTSWVSILACSYCLSFLSSVSYFHSNARSSTSSLMRGAFLIFLALVANLRVDIDSL